MDQARPDLARPDLAEIVTRRAYRGETDTWLTPPEIVNAIGPFDLDPCAAVGQPWGTADTMLTIFDNGLAAEWHGFV